MKKQKNTSQTDITHHIFNVELAKKYGVHESIILNNFIFWIKINQANESKKHYHDGRYWTFNTKKALTLILPYLTERQIRTAIDNLIKKGVILTGNFNCFKYDRTLWYAISNEISDMFDLQYNKEDSNNCQMHLTKKSNRNDCFDNTIPDITSYINTDTNKEKEEKERLSDNALQHVNVQTAYNPVNMSKEEYDNLLNLFFSSFFNLNLNIIKEENQKEIINNLTIDKLEVFEYIFYLHQYSSSFFNKENKREINKLYNLIDFNLKQTKEKGKFKFWDEYIKEKELPLSISHLSKSGMLIGEVPQIIFCTLQTINK